MRKTKLFSLIGCILLAFLVVLVSMGQSGCGKQEISKTTNEQRQQTHLEESVQIVVYQQGKETALGPSSLDFKKLQKICEKMVTSARLAPTPAFPPLEQILENLKNDSEVIEINYLQPKTFNISGGEIKGAQLIIPLHTYIGDPDIKEWADFFILGAETSDYLIARLSGDKTKKDFGAIKELL